MNRMTDYMKKKVLDASLGKGAAGFPTKVYIAAFKTATTDAGGGTEIIGGAYTRKEVTFGAATISGVAGLSSNTNDIEFPIATADWGTVTHLALMDAATGGNMLYHGAVTASKKIDTGDMLRILPTDVKVYQE